MRHEKWFTSEISIAVSCYSPWEDESVLYPVRKLQKLLPQFSVPHNECAVDSLWILTISKVVELQLLCVILLSRLL